MLEESRGNIGLKLESSPVPTHLVLRVHRTPVQMPTVSTEHCLWLRQGWRWGAGDGDTHTLRMLLQCPQELGSPVWLGKGFLEGRDKQQPS